MKRKIKPGDVVQYKKAQNTGFGLVVREVQFAWGAIRYEVCAMNRKFYIWDKYLKSITKNKKGEK
tara:strand:- start:234 stop:428 length:195 start_codon:yes stop_codon:yes gene_type:complete